MCSQAAAAHATSGITEASTSSQVSRNIAVKVAILTAVLTASHHALQRWLSKLCTVVVLGGAAPLTTIFTSSTDNSDSQNFVTKVHASGVAAPEVRLGRHLLA